MSTRSARFYDALYHFKDYQAASLKVQTHITKLYPSARTLLDVACGTGKHLEWLKQDYEVEGLDISKDLLEIAQRRCPAVRFHRADMADFKLDHLFDVVTCLFSSIAYVKTSERFQKTILNFSSHLVSGGLLFLEPFFSPDQFRTGSVTTHFVDEPDVKIAWMYKSERRENLGILNIHYLISTNGSIESFNELHEVGLFSDQDYSTAFDAAGLDVFFDEKGLFGRGLYICRKRF